MIFNYIKYIRNGRGGVNVLKSYSFSFDQKNMRSKDLHQKF